MNQNSQRISDESYYCDHRVIAERTRMYGGHAEFDERAMVFTVEIENCLDEDREHLGHTLPYWWFYSFANENGRKDTVIQLMQERGHHYHMRPLWGDVVAIDHHVPHPDETVEVGDDGSVWVTARIAVPARYEVCPTCNGKGRHVNPSIDAHGLSAEDFYEDPGFAEDYFGGVYDVPCNECGGNNVVPTFIEDGLTDRQKMAVDYVFEMLADAAAFAAESAAERRMGA